MTARVFRLLSAVSLVLGVMAYSLAGGADGTARAANHDSCLYFPWLPNGVEIYDPVTDQVAGPFYSAMTIQNMEDESISVFFMPYDDCDTANPGIYFQELLGPGETKTFHADHTGWIDSGTGGAHVVTARFQADPTKSARIAGTQRQVSPSSLSAIGASTPSHVTASGYTALDDQGVHGSVSLPIVQTNSNWNTIIRAANFDTQDNANIHIQLYEAGTGDMLGPYFQLTGPGEVATFDLRDLEIPDGWIGRAEVIGGLPVGAVAERIKVETNMLLINTSRHNHDFGGEGVLFAPLVFQDWNYWNTGISIGNDSNAPNDITATFYDLDGNEVFSEDKTLPANGMDYFYLPAGEGEPFIGFAIVTSADQIFGAVDEVKYFGEDPDTGHAMSYIMERRGAREGFALTFPHFAKGDPDTASGDTSGIQLFNIANGEAEVEIMFYHRDGTPALAAPESFVLPGWSGKTVYSLDYQELPVGFTGYAVVRNLWPGLPGESEIIAVSNLVNYSVQYDGSATYNQRMYSEMMICGNQC
jgi:hypothetical protein